MPFGSWALLLKISLKELLPGEQPPAGAAAPHHHQEVGNSPFEMDEHMNF